MLDAMEKSPVEQEEHGVDAFLSSLEWLYITHRYSTKAQGKLLRLLTLSGLATSSWLRFSGQLITLAPQTARIRKVMNQEEVDSAHLRQAVEEIWSFAKRIEIRVEKPPVCPVYLTGYGYTQQAYLADLRQVYDAPDLERYESPWPADQPLPQQTGRQLHFVHEAVAMMGTTARAIDWLVERGTQRGHENESNPEPV
jgi:hypothetical protein